MDRRCLLGALGGLFEVGLLPTIASGAPADSPPAWKAVEDLARKEGAVTLYHTFSPSGMPPLIQEFNKTYPEIRVTELRISSQQFYQRFPAEYQAGRDYADVCANAMDDVIRKWDFENWIAHWSPPEAAGVPKSLTIGDSLWAVQLVRQIIAYNSQLVTPSAAPKDWPDLFDERWKGKIGLSPPWRAVGPLQAINFIEKHFKISNSAERFKALDVRFFEGAPGVLQALIRGDVEVAELADLLLNPAMEDGAPIGLVYPKSGVTFTTIVLFVPNKCPHPNAGRVLANWLLSKKGQISLEEFSGAAGSRLDIPGPTRLPANKALNLVNGDAITTMADQTRIVQEWRRVFHVT